MDGPTASILPSRTTSTAFSMAGFPVPSRRRAPTKAFTRADVPVCPLLAKATTNKAAKIPSMWLVRLMRFIEFSMVEFAKVSAARR